MATVSSISTAKGLGNPNRTEQDRWDFSIRAGVDHQSVEQYTDDYTAQLSNQPPLDDLDRSINNGTPKSTKSKDKADVNYLTPYKQGLKPDIGGSRSGSEPDSLIDLYKQRNSMREKSIDSPMPSPRHIGVVNDALGASTEQKDDDADQSRWIHKDKLAEIERKEMEAAGISPPPVRSKSRSRRAQSPEKITNGVAPQDEDPLPAKENKRRRVRSPPTTVEQEDTEEQGDSNGFDLRTPEEIAADSSMDQPSSPVYKQQGLRSSSSRIPLPRSSPMPLPQEHIERNTPLPRKRGASGNWDGGDSILYNRSRSRGNSIGSQVLLDDIDPPSHGQESSPSSPTTESRIPANSKHLHKVSTSTPTSTSKPRSTSATQGSTRSPSSSVVRPKSRSGLEPRPLTAINRPQGDAPWLKDMYKPDPMLPPEQQLLPTHAKRLQEEARRQEQWDQAQRDAEARKQARREELHRAGREPDDGYDEEGQIQMQPSQKEFSPLAEYTSNGLQPSPETARNGGAHFSAAADQQDRSEWPLTRGAAGNAMLEGVGGSGLPGSGDKIGNAGYSALPRVRPGVEGMPSESYRATVTSPGNSNKGRTTDPFEKERLVRMEGEMPGEEKGGRQRKKKDGGGCCGCVVM